MNIITALDDFINTQKSQIDFLAMVSKFKQREGFLTPITFLIAFTFGLHELNDITLDLLASKCEEIQDNLKLTKQALFQRLEFGAEFLKEIYLTSFSKYTNTTQEFKHIDVLNQFSDVKFTDGTTISLPDKLENLYKGMGGKNADSAMKIQATYSLFNRVFTEFNIFSATEHDCSYNKTLLDKMLENELHVNDLGYFDKKYFSEVDDKRAFYISRIKKNTVAYELNNEDYSEVAFDELLNNCENNIDKELFLKTDKQKMLKIRLVGVKLPENKINEKKRKANKLAKQKGKVLTEKEKIFLEWFIVITNVPEDMLCIETISELYRLRWQIELSFKALKSGLSFDKFSNCGENYFKCLLYGKLIFMSLTMNIYAKARFEFYINYGRLISIQRFLKNIRSRINSLKNALLKPCIKTFNELTKSIISIAKRSLFEKRKRKTTEYKLMEHEFPINAIQIPS